MALRIAVDSGGTFTDVCVFDERTGRVDIWKLPSTPDDPSRGIVDGIRQILEQLDADPSDVRFVGHGTTVATNALIEHRGVKTGLVTTEGFRDLLEIGRQKRPHLYDSRIGKPPTLVRRALRFEARQRQRHDGSVEVALDEAGLRVIAAQLRNAQVEALAICFLYSYQNPAHEERAEEILAQELPGVFICRSSFVAPEFREFERLSTVVVNAYLGPVMQRYIERLYASLKTMGIRVEPKLTQSNGGAISFGTAAKLPVRTLLSGPTTGLVAARAIASAAGYSSIITFDMGGTSSDVALLHEGAFEETSEATAGGYPIRAPMLDIQAVGAGGGSIAMIDSGGHLKVGPRSAGAYPGPVCYGKGNDEPTVTDANVVLGTLHGERLLGGRMPIRRDLAVAAVERLAVAIGLTPMEAAQGIITVATANMAKAIRVVSVQRGHDPRDYALFAFGGAGPLHAARLARELDIRRVIVPLTPGALCAAGLLMTDLRSDFVQAKLVELGGVVDGTPGGAGNAGTLIGSVFAELKARAAVWFDEEGIAASDRSISMQLDMRYRGQNYDLGIPVDADRNEPDLDSMRQDFERAHLRRYGFNADGDPVQIVNFRLSALGRMTRLPVRLGEPEADSRAVEPVGTRAVWYPELGALRDTPIYAREHLPIGYRMTGPAVIEQMDSTTVLLPGMTLTVDASRSLLLEFA